MCPCSKGGRQYLGCSSKCIASSWREAIFPPSAQHWSDIRSSVSNFGLPQYKEGHGFTGASPVKGHYDFEGTRASDMRRG